MIKNIYKLIHDEETAEARERAREDVKAVGLHREDAESLYQARLEIHYVELIKGE